MAQMSVIAQPGSVPVTGLPVEDRIAGEEGTERYSSVQARQRRWYPMAARLVRPQQGKMIAGVCAGLSERFGVSVTLIRILFVVFALVGAAEILYLILWIVVPKE